MQFGSVIRCCGVNPPVPRWALASVVLSTVVVLGVACWLVVGQWLESFGVSFTVPHSKFKCSSDPQVNRGDFRNSLSL